MTEDEEYRSVSERVYSGAFGNVGGFGNVGVFREILTESRTGDDLDLFASTFGVFSLILLYFYMYLYFTRYRNPCATISYRSYAR